VTIRLRSYRDNPVVFVRLPRADWLIVKRMAITRGARRSDVIREAVDNAVAAVDPNSLLPCTPTLRHPRWWIETQARETRPYRWFRRLKLIAKTRANGGVCSIELRNPHMGFFAQVYWCIAIFQYCERHGLTPRIRCTGLNYVDAERGPDWLEYYFTKLQSETSDLRKVRYTTTIYDVKLVGLAVRQHTSMEEARRVLNRHLRVKPHYPYRARASCATDAGGRRTRLAPPVRVPVLS